MIPGPSRVEKKISIQKIIYVDIWHMWAVNKYDPVYRNIKECAYLTL